MGKLITRIFSLLSPLLIFSSEVKGTNVFNIHDIHRGNSTNSLDNVYKIELLPKPPPLTLKQSNVVDNDILAGHRSHASHASHVSHRSGSSSSPSDTDTSPSPGTTKPPQSDPAKTWQATKEWQEKPCKLYRHDVLITLNDNHLVEGNVTECKDDSIEVTLSGSGNTKSWIYLKNIKALLWK